MFLIWLFKSVFEKSGPTSYDLDTMSIVNGVTVAIPPPEGYLVDFDNPQRRSVIAVYCVAGIGMFFATIFMLQRIYVKLVVHRSLWIDDCKLHPPALLPDRIVMLLMVSTRLRHYFVGESTTKFPRPSFVYLILEYRPKRDLLEMGRKRNDLPIEIYRLTAVMPLGIYSRYAECSPK